MARFYSGSAPQGWRKAGLQPELRGPWGSMADAMRDADSLLEADYERRVDECEQPTEADDLRHEFESARVAFDPVEADIVISTERAFAGRVFYALEDDSELYAALTYWNKESN